MIKELGVLYCGECYHLSMTEAQQDRHFGNHKERLPHTCYKYNLFVTHKGNHPNLPRLGICIQEKGHECEKCVKSKLLKKKIKSACQS